MEKRKFSCDAVQGYGIERYDVCGEMNVFEHKDAENIMLNCARKGAKATAEERKIVVFLANLLGWSAADIKGTIANDTTSEFDSLFVEPQKTAK